MNRVMKALTALTAGALLADVVHRASHAPWLCGDECMWPWGRRGSDK